MFFIIKSSNPALDLKLHRTKRRARSLLILYPMGVTEALLNHYLVEKYNKSLMQACQAILTNMVFVQNMQQEIIAKIPDPELNEIAKVITYGNGLIPGSRILKKILEV